MSNNENTPVNLRGLGTAINKILGLLDSKVDALHTLDNNTDLNSVTDSGMYRIGETYTNGPDSGSSYDYAWGQMLVVHGGVDTVAQLVFPFNETKMVFRTGNPLPVGTGTPGQSTHGEWNEWETVANISDLSKYLPLTGGTVTGEVKIEGVNKDLAIRNTTSGRTARLQSNASELAAILYNWTSDSNYSALILRPETNSATTRLQLNTRSGNTTTSYNVYHEGNLPSAVKANANGEVFAVVESESTEAQTYALFHEGNPPTAEVVGAAKSEEHNIRTFTSLEQIGLSNDDMVQDDFISNIKAINTALGDGDTILYLTTTNADNLHLSVISKLNADMDMNLDGSATLSIKISRTGDVYSAITTDVVYNTMDEAMYIYSCIYNKEANPENDTFSNFVITTHPDGFLPMSGGNVTGELTINGNEVYHTGNNPSYNDLKDKPFYSEISETTSNVLTWDGNTDGLLFVELHEGTGFYKVSDTVLNVEDFIGASITYPNPNEDFNITITEEALNLVVEDLGNAFLVADDILVVKKDNTTIGDVVHPKAGLYFIRTNIGVHPNKLEFASDVFTTTSEVVHPLDPKYLPDTVADKDFVTSKIEAIPTPDVSGQIGTHNTATDAHNDIRLDLSNLNTKLNNFLNVTDTTKDQLSEIIALIEANADSIESITSGKVNVSDIIDNLTTNVANKPLSAAQGVVLRGLISDLQNSLNDFNDRITNGDFDGKDGQDGYTPVKGVDYFDGKDGKDGYTPVKGIDYYTTEEKLALVNEILAEFKSTIKVAKIGEVTLLADAWVIGEENLYSQVVSIEGVTENSQVDLTPSVQQLAVFYNKDLTFVTENDGGVVTVYAIGQKPANDYTIQVTITEVEL